MPDAAPAAAQHAHARSRVRRPRASPLPGALAAGAAAAGRGLDLLTWGCTKTGNAKAQPACASPSAAGRRGGGVWAAWGLRAARAGGGPCRSWPPRGSARLPRAVVTKPADPGGEVFHAPPSELPRTPRAGPAPLGSGGGGRAPQARSWAPPSPPAPARVSASREDGEEPWAVLPHSLQSEAFWKRITPETSRLFHGLRASSDPLPVLWGHPQARPHPVPRALRSAHLGPPPPSTLRGPVSSHWVPSRARALTPAPPATTGCRGPRRPAVASGAAQVGHARFPWAPGWGRKPSGAATQLPAETWTACRPLPASWLLQAAGGGSLRPPPPVRPCPRAAQAAGAAAGFIPRFSPGPRGSPPRTAAIFPRGGGQMQ